MRNAGPGWVFVPLFIILALVVLFSLPVGAHTLEERQAWIDDWTQRAFVAGDPTILLMDELREFEARNPLPSPVQKPARATERPSGASDGTYRGMGANVEQWRSLVAHFFPPEHVDRMLRIMKCESGGNPYAHNMSTDVRGLFQIRYPLWSKVWPGDYFDPWTNVAIAYQIWLEQGYRAWECNRLI